ncbi:MAG: hypothetical protein EAZ85_05975 [Bacteroidetes bacterium]|nr:MAG: hypothetical protein EAZ85_05975 [Bacteroidota bacterium]TAG89646.1 MAG: hypothetical protein EAZ20_05960 [Bacteroidota bacterium]
MKKLLFISLLLILNINLLAQRKQIDSLKKLEIKLSNQKNFEKDTNYIKTLIQISDAYHNIQADTSLIFAKKAEKLAEKYQFERQIAEASRMIGVVYRVKGEYDNATKYAEKSLFLSKKINHKINLGGAYNLFGNIYDMQGKYPQALENYFQALKIRDEIKDMKGKANTIGNIALIYTKQKNFEDGLKYNFEALKIREKIKDQMGISSNYNNIAIIYHQQHKFEEALKFYYQSLKIKIKIGEKKGIAMAFNNIGRIHLEKKDYYQADTCFSKALSIFGEIGDKMMVCEAIQGLARSELGENQYQKALEHAKKALDLAYQTNTKENIKNSLLTLSKCYEGNKNYEEALRYFTLYKTEYDSLINNQNEQKAQKMQAEYDYNKKEISLKNQQQKKLADQHFYTLMFVYALIFVLIILFFINRSRNKIIKAKNIIEAQKTEIEQNQEEILAQNELLSEQKYALEQNQEEILTQKDLLSEQNIFLDEYRSKMTQSINAALLIQQAILPNINKIKPFFKDFFAIYLPKDTVSGDFYWIEKIDNKIIVATADCTGHGISGAFMSLIGHTLLDQIVLQHKIMNPAEILTNLHQEIQIVLRQKETNNNSGMDIAVVVLEKKSENSQIKLTYSGAKRPLYYIDAIENEKINILKGTRKSIGGEQNNSPFENQSVVLHENSIIYMCSDGFSDQSDLYRKRIGEVKVLECLNENSHQHLSFQEQKLFELLKNHQKNTEQRDDIMFLGMKI